MTSRAIHEPFDAESVVEAITTEVGVEPAVVHVRPWPAYAVDFAALEVESDEAISPIDRAILSLVRARGLGSTVDAARYLGLGVEVARLSLERLVDEGWVGRTSADLSRFARTRANVVDGAPVQGPRTCELLPAGQEVLTAGKKTVRARRPARLIFWAAPLWYLWTSKEASGRYAAATRRDPPIEVEAVPPPLRTIEDALGLSPEARVAALGIEERVPGVPGRLVGVAPGSGWEVRHTDSHVVLAAFSYPGDPGLTWTVFAIFADRLIPCPEVPAGSVDSAGLTRPGRLAHLVRSSGAGVLDEQRSYTGAFRLLCDEDAVLDRAAGAEPSEVRLPVPAETSGSTAVRVRAVPATRAAADRALVAMVRRHRSEYRADARGTIDAVWKSLQEFWEVSPTPPPDHGWVAGELWRAHDMRRIICEARFAADLIVPYEEASA